MKKLIVIMMAVFISINTALFASYKEALSLYEEKKYKESLGIIAKELDSKKDYEKDSFNYDMRFLAAHNHWKLGNITSAVSHFRRCSEIKKDTPDPLMDLSFLLLDNKRYGEAGYYANQALKISENPIIYYLLGKSSYKAGSYYRAKEYFEKALSLDPEFGLSYNYLGLVLMKLGKYSEANTAFSAALSGMPDSPEVMNNLAMSYEDRGKLDEALKYFKMANDKNPDNKVIKTNFNNLKGKTEGSSKKG